ncbi:MAG: hypothetical protein ACRDL2_03680 [Gaiellaceae bacterium]
MSTSPSSVRPSAMNACARPRHGSPSSHLVADAEQVEDEGRVRPERDPGAELDQGEVGGALERESVDACGLQRDRRRQSADAGADDDRARHRSAYNRYDMRDATTASASFA